MKFSAAAVLAVAAGVSAFENVTYTTEIVTAVTTFCPEATVLTHAGSTYTISSATTLTITDCPCTITKPVTVASSVSCVTCSASSAPAYTNGTGVYPTSSAAALSGAGLAGVLGLAAFFL
ncbi:Clock-controlled protein 6 [Cytospora mali]|uniref:Clock-controlled protein 6 n=1 Tax=Cytospora mali TaxID=578113 RepID=A0A194V3I4_CYTMA|nr:Clock-controlled protein 6 [Valsa mali var. pyri (nom. inval.)]